MPEKGQDGGELMSFRPEGWQNPHRDRWKELDHVMTLEEDYETNQHFSFEAGADAMLEALREKGNADLLRFIYAVVKVRPIETIGKGKFIFIPDEEVS